ncbi:protection of telomeres protein 1-like [Panonychus citri]|uniref:protection of telomeres protein 1-like n=1 Tax=Panonychus citri TaxID=50023 RepID=UPI0023081B8F|nr:protection of telomeres protein 1-like [Panonychus citri]XP_053205618.1 protection of telomeres protein 1-like [Panonychus citri]
MSTSKYHYSSLKSILNSSDKYNHIFGVIRKYHEQGVYIRDETYDSIKVNFSSTFEAILPHIKPGNVIRIHRLISCGGTQFRCIKVSDVLLFSSFKDKDAASYKVRFEAKQPTIELSDFARVAELEKWLANKLLEVSLRTVTIPTWYDLVCQVVDIKDLAPHRVILIVYDAFNPGLRINWLIPSEQWEGFPMDKLVCVTAWDRHAIKARRLEKGSLIAFFNLQASEAKLQPGNFELHLRGGTHYGKMIRTVHPNSFLGVGYKSRMVKLHQEMNIKTPTENQPKQSNAPKTIIEEIVDSNSTLNPAHSTQLLNSDDVADVICDISDIGSSISDESPKNKESPKPIISVKKSKLSYDVQFPVIFDLNEPENLIGIKDYLAANTDERCCIKARVMSYKPISRSIIDYIQLVCPNCDYKESPSISTINTIKKLSGPRTKISCPECQKKSEPYQLNATLCIYLYLSDTENYEIPVTLSKLDLIKLLGVRMIPVMNDIEEANKIFDFLDFICPSINLEGPISPFNSDSRPFLKWIIQRQPGGLRIKWEYRALTVFPIN